MEKYKLANDYTLEQLRIRSEKINFRQIPANEAMAIKPDFLAGYEASEKNAEQERIKAKIETLTKFRYRSYESIEEELNNLKKQLENDRT